MSRRAQQIVIAVVALALVVSVGAVGLSGVLTGNGAPQAAQQGEQQVDPASQPSPSPTVAPAAPAALTEQSPAGAQATLRYLLGTYDYMMATGDTAAWEQMIDPSCQVCVRFVANARKLHEEGGWAVGGGFAVASTTFEGSGEPPASGIATAAFTQAPQTIVVDPAQAPQTQQELSAQIQARLAWDGERWRVGDLSILEPGTAPSDAGGAATGAGGA